MVLVVGVVVGEVLFSSTHSSLVSILVNLSLVNPSLVNLNLVYPCLFKFLLSKFLGDPKLSLRIWQGSQLIISTFLMLWVPVVGMVVEAMLFSSTHSSLFHLGLVNPSLVNLSLIYPCLV